MKDYLTIACRYQYEFTISKSQFICYLCPVKGLEDGQAFVSEIKQKHRDATHNCYAIVGIPASNEMRFSDDGEPTGTAGAPIHNAIVKNELYGVAAVVTRYFGGIKLGAGGLVNAYSKATAEAIRASQIVTEKSAVVVSLALTYSEYKLAKMYIYSTEHTLISTEYDTGITVTLAIPTANLADFTAHFTELMSGSSRISIIEEKYIQFKK
ncbi:MAG: YigZ family protein [Bacillota bacterium]